MNNSLTPPPSPTILVGWIFVVLMYGLSFGLLVVPTTITAQLNSDLGFTIAQIGIISSAFMYTDMLMQIPAGIILDKFGCRRVLNISVLILTIACFLFAFAQNMGLVTLSRFMMGLGGSTLFIGSLLIARDHFSAKIYPLLIATVEAMSGVGAILIPAIYTVFASYHWRTLSVALAIFAGLMALCVILWVRDKPDGDKATTDLQLPFGKALTLVAKEPRIWLLAIYIGCSYAHIAAFTDMWRIPLIQKFFPSDAVSAVALNALSFLGFTIGCFAIGYLSNFFKKKNLMLWCIILELLTIMIMHTVAYHYYATNHTIYFYTWAIGLFTSGFFTGGLLLSYDVCKTFIPAQAYGAASGILSMAFGLIGVISIPWVGYLLRSMRVQGFTIITLPTTIMCAVAVIVLLIFMRLDKAKK